MKAIIYRKYGPPDVLHLAEVEKPVPKDGEVLIKVYASTVNRTDCGFLRADPWIVRFFNGFAKPKNAILGSEFAGQIEAIGKGATSFGVGDRVFGFSGVTFGAHAEYIVMHEEAPLTTIPQTMSYEEAAPSLEGSHYALCDIRAARIQKGQRILIYGATGAIGSAAVQLVRHIGAEITAVCGTKNVALVKSLGADKVIDYEKEDFTNDTDTYDVVFDAVGKSSFGTCRPLLKPRGIYLSTDLGFLAQNPLLALATPLFGKKRVLFPLPMLSKKDVVFIKELMEAGTFRPVIDRRYPLEEIANAYRYVETGQKTGNVVITVARDVRA